MAAALSLVLLQGVGSAHAHPVAQGRMEVELAADAIELTARVSNEEILVASAFAPDAPPDAKASSPADHAGYLLSHLAVEADGVRLAGRQAGFEAAASREPQALATFHFRYALPVAASAPGRLTLSQSVLNDIQFAPGNPWEVTFLVGVKRGAMALSGGLLTREQPLEISIAADQPPRTAGAASSAALLLDYFKHGLRHILEGWDHLLFVCALVLAIRSFKALLLIITAFTAAHTLTLVLSVLGYVRLPSNIVEPMIAASIVFVAAQNAFWPQRSQGGARAGVAFAFGLFHGLGFAGGLLEVMQGLSSSAVMLALAGFALGVEAGHQLIGLPLFGAAAWLRMRQADGPEPQPSFRFLPVLRTASLLIAAAGCFYFVAALRAR